MSLNSTCHHSSHSNDRKHSSNAVNHGHTNSNIGSKQAKDMVGSGQHPATHLTLFHGSKARHSASCPNADAIPDTTTADTIISTDPNTCKAQVTQVPGIKLPPILVHLM
jgi:hypothetical protein